MRPLTYNLVLFAVTAGVGSVVSVLIGSTGPTRIATIWGMPVGAVIGINLGLTETERTAELQSLKSAALWAFAAVSIGLSVVVTYREFGPGTVSADLVWIVLPSLLVFVLYTPVSTLLQNS